MKKKIFYFRNILIGFILLSLIVSIAYRIKKTKNDYNNFREFMYEKIFFYATYYQGIPDSIYDIQKFVELPSEGARHSWLTPEQKLWDKDIMQNLLTKSQIKSDSTFISVIVDNQELQTIDFEEIDFMFLILRNKNVIIQKIGLDSSNLPSPGYYFFSNYQRSNEQKVKLLSSKFKKYQSEKLGLSYSNIYKDTLDIKKLYFYVKRKNDGFAYQIRYNPQHLSEPQIEILFNNIRIHVLSDSVFNEIDMMNFSIVIPSTFSFEKLNSVH
jgi:hypothetical protein